MERIPVTIEFHCPQCQKLLKTADDKAGVEARCPGCGGALIVPFLPASGESIARVEAPAIAEADSDRFSRIARLSESGPESLKPCPVCAEPISRASDQCPNCGEPLALGLSDVPRPPHFVTSEILARTWVAFQQKLGVLLGVSFLLWSIQLLFVVFVYVAAVGLAFVTDHLRRGKPVDFNSPAMIAVLVVIVMAGMIAWSAITCLLQGGYRRILLDSAKERATGVGQLFSGGRFFIRLLLANLLFAFVVGAGLILFLAPGVYAAVALWPYSFVIVDQDCGVVEAFERSWKLTAGNRLAGFVLLLAMTGIYMAGSFIPCLGTFAPIFAEPFALLGLAVAYLEMDGRVTAEQIPPG